GSCYKTDTSYLEKLLDQQQTLLDILGECTKISLDYKLDTEMAVDFEEPTYGRVSKLDKNKTLSTSKENFKEYGQGISQSTGGVCTITSADGDCRKIETYKVCSLKGFKKHCWNETKDITAIWIKQYGKEFNVGYDYKLPSEFYRYVLIPSGKSVDNTTPSTNKLGKYQNYINVGFANYPVHYSTPTGLYQLDINYKTVGYKDHFTQYIENKIDKNTNIITYDCEYDVKDEEVIRCEEEDGCIDVDDEKELGNVRLIYRPISLVNPFPAINGSGRKTGSNWCNDKDCSKDNAIVSKYILNNRNVNYDANDYDGSNVYTKREPMYTVVLNPAVIKQIREYNKNNTYDDFNLYCSDGHKCQSEFIKEKFQGLFTGCGASNDFDYCDTEDGYRR
ncbi:MAG: hypothetical protein RR266_04110, partial [Bacilli bacterium]